MKMIKLKKKLDQQKETLWIYYCNPQYMSYATKQMATINVISQNIGYTLFIRES